MTAFPLRPYQLEIRQAVEAAWSCGMQRPAVVAATGLGKTVSIADLAARWVAAHRMSTRQRVLIIAHREELLDQAAAKVRTTASDLRVGIVQADRDNCTADIVIGSVPTLAKPNRRARIAHVGLVIVDEAHHAVARTYRDILAHYGCFETGGARALGVTATMIRSDDLALGDVWQDVVYVKGIESGVREGYLVPPRGRWIYVPDLDLNRVKKTAGDYQNGDLGRAIEGSMAPQKLAAAYREHCPDRQGIVFAPTVHCAQIYADELNAQGFKTVMVDGKTPKDVRKARFEAIRSGDAQILANCGVATEGTDLPPISAIVIGRPTKSEGLHTQMVGRGLRTWPGKEDCLVLYVAGKRPSSLQTHIQLAGGATIEVASDEELVHDIEGEELELFSDEQIVLPGSPPVEFVDGDRLVTVEVDLFAGSKSAWCRTVGGTWFLPAGNRLIVVKPAPSGLWDVVWCDKYSSPSGFIAADVADIGYAMAAAEANISSSEKRANSKGASWRAKAPNRAQLELARRYGIIPGDMQAGELQHHIDLACGTMRIDPYVAGRN